MIFRNAHIKFGVARVAVRLVGIRRFPLILPEMRLRERDEHPFIVGRPENFGEAQMRARLAPVVVSVDEVDAKILEPFETLLGTLVSRPGGANLRVVERDRTQENATAVQIEVASVDPELTESETFGQSRIQ